MESDEVRQFNVREVAPKQRLQYWENVVARNTAPTAFMPDNGESFESSLVQGSFERFTFSQVYSSAMRAYRGKEHMRGMGCQIYLCLQTSGTVELYSNGQMRHAGDNSLILYDDSTPYRFRALSPVRTIAVGFPASLIKARLPAYGEIVLRPLDGLNGVNNLLHSTLTTMDRMFAERRMRHFSYHVFLGLIDLLVASIEEAHDCTSNISTMAAWAGKIRAYVEANLDDPDLTPATIARQFGISSRYLRLIFATESDGPGGGETLRRFILRRRLEECANMLALPASSFGSITMLAYNWGFSDGSYFARRFGEYFGMAPRDYRLRQLQAREREITGSMRST